MKKHFIALIILFVLMGVFNMDILGRSITDIQRRMIGQTNYRINVVKGVVESENINKTYNCYIAGETVVYPNIPTFSRNPKLQPGDPVTIEFINGCRETPAILAPEDIRERPDTTELVTNIVAVYYRPNAVNYNLKIYDMDGNEINDFIVSNTNAVHQWVTVDKNSYVYLITNWNTIRKYDPSDGSTIKIKAIGQDAIAIDISSDEFIYTLELNSIAGWDLKKRDNSTLNIISTINFGNGNSFDSLAIDDANNCFYVVDSIGDNIEKRNLATGAVLASRAIDSNIGTWSSIGLLSNLIYGGGGTGGWEGWYIAKTLGADAIAWVLGAGLLPYNLTIYNNQYIFISGWDGSNYVIRKYDSTRTLVWEKIIGGIALYGTLSIGACSYK